MRKWRSPEVSADSEWAAVNHQVVLYKICRVKISILAHETPMSGLLGINKTYYQIMNYFY